MIEFLLIEGNRPFMIAIALMFGIAMLEGVTAVFGVGISRLVESLIPDSFGDADIDVDMDADADVDFDADADLDADADVGASTALSKLLGWLCVGRVPVLVLVVIFLTVFGLSGFVIQGTVSNVAGGVLPGLVASGVALVVTVPLVRLFASALARLIPKDESDAVSNKSFVGRVATITLGTARHDEPTQAKVYDEHGLAHYVMVEPDLREDVFETGDQILLISRTGGRFRAIRNPSPAMVDEKAR